MGKSPAERIEMMCGEIAALQGEILGLKDEAPRGNIGRALAILHTKAQELDALAQYHFHDGMMEANFDDWQDVPSPGGPTDPAPEPPSNVWSDSVSGPIITNVASPRHEVEFLTPQGKYTMAHFSVGVNLKSFDPNNRWQDILAISIGKNGQWKNINLLAHLAVRSNKMKIRAGLGTKMGDPMAQDDAGNKINKAKHLMDFTPRLHQSVKFECRNEIASGLSTNVVESEGRQGPIHLAPQNLPVDMTHFEVGHGESIIVHLGAIPNEFEGVTDATFRDLSIRLVKAPE